MISDAIDESMAIGWLRDALLGRTSLREEKEKNGRGDTGVGNRERRDTDRSKLSDESN